MHKVGDKVKVCGFEHLPEVTIVGVWWGRTWLLVRAEVDGYGRDNYTRETLRDIEDTYAGSGTLPEGFYWELNVDEAIPVRVGKDKVTHELLKMYGGR